MTVCASGKSSNKVPMKIHKSAGNSSGRNSNTITIISVSRGTYITIRNSKGIGGDSCVAADRCYLAAGNCQSRRPVVCFFDTSIRAVGGQRAHRFFLGGLRIDVHITAFC